MEQPKLSVNIPEQIIAGFKHKGQVENPVAYLTYTNPITKEICFKQSWTNWTKYSDNESVTYSNKPLSCFTIIGYMGGMGRDSRQVKCRVKDPRGFVVEITLDNAIALLNSIGYDAHTGFKATLCYMWDNNGMALKAMSEEEYIDFHKVKSSLTPNLKLKDLIPGHYYDSTVNSLSGAYYIGKVLVPILQQPDMWRRTAKRNELYPWKFAYETCHLFYIAEGYKHLHTVKSTSALFVEIVNKEPLDAFSIEQHIKRKLLSHVEDLHVYPILKSKEIKEFRLNISPIDQDITKLKNTTVYFLSPDKQILLEFEINDKQKAVLQSSIEIIDNNVYTIYHQTSYYSYTEGTPLTDIMKKYNDYVIYGKDAYYKLSIIDGNGVIIKH